MITFAQLGRYGRLGNQLFQYAMLKSVSLATGYEMKIPNPNEITYQNQKCLLDKFNIKCDYLTEKDMSSLNNNFIERDHSKFYPQAFYVPDGTNYHGYFQSYKYFSKFDKQIKKELRLNPDLQEFAKDYVNNLKSNNEEVVSLHIRRGDNSDGTNPEYLNYYGQGDILTPDSEFGQYFYSALEIFNNKNVKFLVFSGGSRKGMKNNQSDIDWCKTNLKDDRFVFCEGNSDIQDFAIMKNCDHHVTSHMTSFGYWAAHLNDKDDKIVIAPSNYSIPDDGRVKRGFYPSNWKII